MFCVLTSINFDTDDEYLVVAGVTMKIKVMCHSDEYVVILSSAVHQAHVERSTLRALQISAECSVHVYTFWFIMDMSDLMTQACVRMSDIISLNSLVSKISGYKMTPNQWKLSLGNSNVPGDVLNKSGSHNSMPSLLCYRSNESTLAAFACVCSSSNSCSRKIA